MNIGDILVCKYGYNCTLVEFYIVKRVSKTNAWLQPLESIITSHDGYGQAGFVMPGKENDKPIIRRKIYKTLMYTFVKVDDYKYASEWDGKEVAFDTYD